MIITEYAAAQTAVQWNALPDLPDEQGFAGMLAGVSHNTLTAIGGTNFPEKRPWKGGEKKWYNDIYVLKDGIEWINSSEKMPLPTAYGISVSYNNKVIVVGGSNENGHYSFVRRYEWDGKSIIQSEYPNLTAPLAHMGGGLLGNMIVVF